jgi:hypothetical protein
MHDLHPLLVLIVADGIDMADACNARLMQVRADKKIDGR